MCVNIHIYSVVCFTYIQQNNKIKKEKIKPRQGEERRSLKIYKE